MTQYDIKFVCLFVWGGGSQFKNHRKNIEVTKVLALLKKIAKVEFQWDYKQLLEQNTKLN